ncbi:hypothetical protein LY76DRAFT_294917 [Colletotrichum caudatum]|nr:hypothetical protein LY76DRAFT_294917 [Colletotrichum caudatum]
MRLEYRLKCRAAVPLGYAGSRLPRCRCLSKLSDPSMTLSSNGSIHTSSASGNVLPSHASCLCLCPKELPAYGNSLLIRLPLVCLSIVMPFCIIPIPSY